MSRELLSSFRKFIFLHKWNESGNRKTLGESWGVASFSALALVLLFIIQFRFNYSCIENRDLLDRQESISDQNRWFMCESVGVLVHVHPVEILFLRLSWGWF